ncbi:MAG: hypothetical protein WDM76_19055 [Limisphaerales bacterium]
MRDLAVFASALLGRAVPDCLEKKIQPGICITKRFPKKICRFFRRSWTITNDGGRTTSIGAGDGLGES